MSLLILCVSLIGLIMSSMALEKPQYNLERAQELFENFIVTYGKTYTNYQEKRMRLQIFTNNLKAINEKNARSGAKFGINLFSDLTVKEFEQGYLGVKTSVGYRDKCKVITDDDVVTNDAPESLCWKSKGAVTPVKNQKRCGSCWAFSTTGSIEGQYFIKHQQLVSFSEQQLVDCSKRNRGCNGGFISDAMTDLMEAGGIETEESYPYVEVTNIKQTCSFDPSKVVGKLTGCNRYQLMSEDKLKEVVATKGPISVLIFANDLMSYQGGVLTGADCQSMDGGHAVLLVGYGTSEEGVAYWRFKNSWSTAWGEEGYFRLSRNENTCHMMNYGNAYENTSPDLL